MNTPGISYRHIAQRLRELIESGEVPPGGQLPSEPALTKEYGVNRATVRDAYLRLIQEGKVVRRSGPGQVKGHFVRPRKPITWPMTNRDRIAHAADGDGGTDVSPVDPWLTVVTNAGYTGHQAIQVRIVGADKRLGDRTLGEIMARADGEPVSRVVVRDRLRFTNGLPQEIARSYFPYDVAEEITALMDTADIQPSVFRLLAERGYRQTGGCDSLRSRMPTLEEGETLKIDGVLPVVDIVRSLRFTPEDRVLLVRHTIALGGEDNTYEWEL